MGEETAAGGREVALLGRFNAALTGGAALGVFSSSTRHSMFQKHEMSLTHWRNLFLKHGMSLAPHLGKISNSMGYLLRLFSPRSIHCLFSPLQTPVEFVHSAEKRHTVQSPHQTTHEQTKKCPRKHIG